ncbi:MAG: hypothetical protein CME58_06500 [Halieaceae bacterium]|nr:hypothetical protein [Halieaceae bacterium]|tara:strand:+ start:2097 stop:2321 length:225 start_codon:yes stop_codon:yes gene_type:complete
MHSDRRVPGGRRDQSQTADGFFAITMVVIFLVLFSLAMLGPFQIATSQRLAISGIDLALEDAAGDESVGKQHGE